MAKTPVTTYTCQECGWATTKWVGRCSQCGGWGTVDEVNTVGASSGTSALTPRSPALPITDVPATASTKTPTGVDELDRVLGGGLVPGAVILLAGEPGVGKSTLLLDVAAKTADALREASERSSTDNRAYSEGKNNAPRGENRSSQRSVTGNGRSNSVVPSAGNVLYISGEESASQVRLRAERIGAMNPNLFLASESDLARVLGHIEAQNPSLVIVDSVQTISDSRIDGVAGGSAQVKAVTSALVHVAKTRGLPVLLVGHVTKDGSIAGPRVLEHLVDVVCQFEGDKHSRLRMVRAVKNRYGATDEVGCFELVDHGIIGLPDPSGLFLSARNRSVPGTCASMSLDGRRPIPVELQGLVVQSSGRPQRTNSGVNSSRVAMIVAILQSRLGLALEQKDIFVSTVGGAQANEPSADIAIALALASAYVDLPVAPGVIAIGEVALTGELRPVTGLQQRLAEATRLGFTLALIPQSHEKIQPPEGLKIRTCSDIKEATQAVLPLSLQP
ncbi:DNA repair protein RadA [Actinotignum urinale]|uniref:DNA repair protein RadA n=1 Tax=Actinotignum urinale TaxID=190146 RepID=UPI0003B3EAEF|nr:AAA family ATPase [Actinotignum urinale]MDY5161082.1 AAA family ATPase [Actinotignum urinale]